MAERFLSIFLSEKLIMKSSLFTILLISSCLSTVMSRNFTIVNNCSQTIWPASYTYAGALETTGFLLETGKKRTLQATSSWIGNIWGRTLCTTNSTTRSFNCVTGDCSSGEIECSDNNTLSPTFLVPLLATSAEFNLAYDNGDDYYTVSVINGYNLPLLVTPENEECENIGCVVDMKKTCPLELRLSNGSSEDPYACKTSCQVNEDPKLCCVGIYVADEDVVGPESCEKTIYSRRFEEACKGAYSYAYDSAQSTFTCSRSSSFVITFCPSSLTKQGKPPLKLILGISSALALIIITAIVVMVRASSMRKSDVNGKNNNMEEVIMLKRYSYTQVKKMTKSLANVLGRGGFGTVYQGKLPDNNRDVAVKILKESNENGEEFMNEVASMSRTSHVNIVSLLGFCYEGSKKAIIYEFIPNGSLDKFISENMSEKKMEWRTLYNIALGVSHGLEYLHNRCVTRIVHFDIKPQNILIGKDSCPKISDFGLAKLCKNNESIISMLDARGTAGYIAPEVFSKNFGGVSHKSDVYSYGMVVLEMIGARKLEREQNIGSKTTSMYFPDYIYKDLENGEILSSLADQIMEEEDEKIVKKMVLVGLWCIQTNPFDRPPMSKVVEMLEGSLEALQIPSQPPMFTVSETAYGIHDITSSFSRQSRDTSQYFEEAIQDIEEENQDSLLKDSK